MKIDILTLFPEMLAPMLHGSILGRAVAAGVLQVDVTQLRDFTEHRQHMTDDYPFGGGAGMVMYAQPIVDAAERLDPQRQARRIYLSPRGRRLDQRIVEELAREERLLLLCGHYEGVDQRALDLCGFEELSIGDYVLTGGELGALVVVDAVARLLPGALGSEESSLDDSFTTGLLEYPQYTRPAEFRGMRVPEVLLGGNHADIERWRLEQSLTLTLERRPDLLDTAPLDEAGRDMLARLRTRRDRLTQLEGAAEALPLSAADAFPLEWLRRFVPEDRFRSARRQCISTKKHAGFLWQAFTMEFIAPKAFGEAAEAALPDPLPRGTRLYFPGDRVLLRLTEPMERAKALRFEHIVAVLPEDTATFLRAGKKGQWLAVKR